MASLDDSLDTGAKTRQRAPPVLPGPRVAVVLAALVVGAGIWLQTRRGPGYGSDRRRG
jgi:hypothetical protein